MTRLLSPMNIDITFMELLNCLCGEWKKWMVEWYGKTKSNADHVVIFKGSIEELSLEFCLSQSSSVIDTSRFPLS